MRYRQKHSAITVAIIEGLAREADMYLRAHRLDVAFLVGTFDLTDYHSQPGP